MCFPEINAQLRTDADFRLARDESYHIGHSILLEIPNFNLVNSIPLDYMHLICLGVMRNLLYKWLGVGDVKHVHLQHRKIEAISWQLENVLKFNTPCEFARKPRSHALIKLWKATEFRNLLLYTGPIAFKSFLRKYIYEHFLVLHVAIRILCCSKLQDFIDYDITIFLYILYHHSNYYMVSTMFQHAWTYSYTARCKKIWSIRLF